MVPFRLVTVTYDRLSTVTSLIDDILDKLAQVALVLFPHWYGHGIPFAEIDASTPSFDSLLAGHVNQHGLLKQGVSIPWLNAARRLCRLGKPPLPREFTASVQVAQLALAIDRSPLRLRSILRDEKSLLRGTSRASENVGMARPREQLHGSSWSSQNRFPHRPS